MGSEWKLVKLGDWVTHQKGFAFKSRDYQNSGHPIVRVSNFTDRSINTADLKYLAQDKAADFLDYELLSDDVVIATVGSWPSNPASVVGKAVSVPLNCEGALLNQNSVRLRAKQGLNQKFLFYSLKLNDYQNYIVSTAQGSANQASITLRDIFGYELLLPTEIEQKLVAEFLVSLDDKIELNRQMNTTLEAMAQALFKSWFVDFDPVIDNALAAGNPIPDELAERAERRKQLHARSAGGSSAHLTPGQPLPAAIQKQFPDRFVFTEEMGWVPEGWEVSTIGDQVENTGGGTPSTKNEAFWKDGTHAFCTPKDMSRLTSWMLMDTERHLTEAGVKKVSSGQLPQGAVLMSSRAPIGYIAISNIPVSVNQGIIAMLPNASFSPLYLLSWAKFNMSSIIDRANGSTFLEISKKNFRPIPFLVPNNSVSQAFNKEADAILEKILSLTEQNISLTNLRDTLLPKLLSGQLRIPEAEQQVAEIS